jgi:hypothetical protein
MRHKQHAITMPKPGMHIGSFALHFHKFVAKLERAFQIPVGYQDETGFHFGAQPDKKNNQWHWDR